MRLSPGEIGKRAQILGKSIPLRGVFDDEIAEIDDRKRQEEEAVEEMEKKRAEEKSIGRKEIISGKMEQPNKEAIYELGNLPVCTKTPRMLITGEAVIYQSFTYCTNDSKYLHRQRSGMNSDWFCDPISTKKLV